MVQPVRHLAGDHVPEVDLGVLAPTDDELVAVVQAGVQLVLFSHVALKLRKQFPSGLVQQFYTASNRRGQDTLAIPGECYTTDTAPYCVCQQTTCPEVIEADTAVSWLDTAILVTVSLHSSRVCMGSWALLLQSHTLTVVSVEPLIMTLESSLNAQQLTALRCPLHFLAHWPLLTSQSTTVLSEPQEAI